MPKSPAIKPAAPVIVIGGANMDLKCRIAGPEIMATSNPGAIAVMPGGVGRNVAETLARLGLPTALIAAIGRDGMGDALINKTGAAGVDMTMILRGRFATGSYAATLSRDGELMIGVAAMQATQRLTPAALRRHLNRLRWARLIVADCNLPLGTLDWLTGFAANAGVPLAIETVSVPKVKRLRRILQKRRPVFALFSNRAEVAAITGKDQATGKVWPEAQAGCMIAACSMWPSIWVSAEHMFRRRMKRAGSSCRAAGQGSSTSPARAMEPSPEPCSVFCAAST